MVAPVTPRVVPTVAEVVTAREVPDVKVVVEAMVPGAMKVAGMVNVIVLTAPAVVIWLAVPNRLKFPAVGDRAPPELAVRVETREVPGVIVPVSVDPDPAKASAPDPKMLMLFADGDIDPPEFPVKVSRLPEPEAIISHTPAPVVT